MLGRHRGQRHDLDAAIARGRRGVIARTVVDACLMAASGEPHRQLLDVVLDAAVGGRETLLADEGYPHAALPGSPEGAGAAAAGRSAAGGKTGGAERESLARSTHSAGTRMFFFMAGETEPIIQQLRVHEAT